MKETFTASTEAKKITATLTPITVAPLLKLEFTTRSQVTDSKRGFWKVRLLYQRAGSAVC